MLPTPIQPKVHALKVSYFAPPCANGYAKEKNVTKFSQNVMSSYNISDYLTANMLCTKSIKSDILF